MGRVQGRMGGVPSFCKLLQGAAVLVVLVLVVAGCGPHAEDTWKRFRIGDVVFRSAGPCARCVVTTTDQATGDRGVEPLRTLATYRRDPAKHSNVNFGHNLVNESKAGRLRVGDPVVLLE